MGEQKWRPRYVRQSGETSEFDFLHEGIARWLEGSIWRWLMDRTAEGGAALVYRLERRLHIELVRGSDRPLGRQQTKPAALLERYWKAHSPKERLTILDAILSDMQDRALAAFDTSDEQLTARLVMGAESLHTILTEGGSAWGAHVGSPSWALVRRVNDTTAELVKPVVSPETDAGRKSQPG